LVGPFTAYLLLLWCTLQCNAVLQYQKGNMTREELVQTSFLLLVAGNATVSGLIALGVYELLKHPDQLELLKSKPEMISQAVEELLRYHTASSFALRRVAQEPVELGYGKVGFARGYVLSANHCDSLLV
jgi:nitric oxide reductase